jgi:hypothetical protein
MSQARLEVEAMVAAIKSAYSPVVERMLAPHPLWDSLLPPDRDCPYPLQGAVNVPLPFEEDS